jgi:hypothetical protein
MQRHLYAVPRPSPPRPVKIVQLEVRRQLREEREQNTPRPRPAA